MLSIETTRYSTVVAAFVDRFPDATATINNHPVDGPCDHWGTNKSLAGAIDFLIRDGSTELLGFHDGPRNMWASDEAIDLVQELAANKVLRYSVAQAPTVSLLRRLASMFISRT